MLKGDRDLDTICAVSTPPGRGGISVIRVSGKRAVLISKKLGSFLPATLESHKVYYGTLTSLFTESQKSYEIDEVVLTYFAEWRSYTGEATIEISFHGNPVIAGEILNNLILAGARMADRGEFTYRSFMSGRMDLTQAEGVLALIESQSKQASRLALSQLKGVLADELEGIELELTRLLAHMEASIDFSTEGLEIISSDEVLQKLNLIRTDMERLIKSYSKGLALRSGIRVVFV
ncbi:MAG: hypothetical protein AB7H97_12425 [Pseudobdellovibrionaceae bacterium]